MEPLQRRNQPTKGTTRIIKRKTSRRLLHLPPACSVGHHSVLPQNHSLLAWRHQQLHLHSSASASPQGQEARDRPRHPKRAASGFHLARPHVPHHKQHRLLPPVQSLVLGQRQQYLHLLRDQWPQQQEVRQEVQRIQHPLRRMRVRPHRHQPVPCLHFWIRPLRPHHEAILLRLRARWRRTGWRGCSRSRLGSMVEKARERKMRRRPTRSRRRCSNLRGTGRTSSRGTRWALVGTFLSSRLPLLHSFSPGSYFSNFLFLFSFHLCIGMLRLKKHKENDARRVILRSSTTGKIFIVRWHSLTCPRLDLMRFFFSFFITLRGV